MHGLDFGLTSMDSEGADRFPFRLDCTEPFMTFANSATIDSIFVPTEANMTEDLYFAHANSFPASVYGKMLTKLSERFQIGYLDTIGHDPRHAVTDCWPQLVEETIETIERTASGPVWGVGHSLGGVLVFYAATRRPDLFRGIVVLDSPLFRPLRARSIWLVKRLRLIDRVTPGGNTLKRRDCWASTEMVFDYFQRKPMFARFDPGCLHDYAEYGTEPDGRGGRRLKFRPEIEHSIYCTLPHDISRHADRLRTPGVYLAAGDAPVLDPRDQRYVRERLRLEVGDMPGSHLFPLEHPLETADAIAAAIARMTALPSSQSV
jgi:pimeloyl-ACP methyl ester carboxylesterase